MGEVIDFHLVKSICWFHRHPEHTVWVSICWGSLLKSVTQIFNKTKELSKHIPKVYTHRLGLDFSSIFEGIRNIKSCFPIFKCYVERKKKTLILVELVNNHSSLSHSPQKIMVTIYLGEDRVTTRQKINEMVTTDSPQLMMIRHDFLLYHGV